MIVVERIGHVRDAYRFSWDGGALCLSYSLGRMLKHLVESLPDGGAARLYGGDSDRRFNVVKVQICGLRRRLKAAGFPYSVEAIASPGRPTCDVAGCYRLVAK